MAETTAKSTPTPQPGNAMQQAGGGVSGLQREVSSLNTSMLAHLQRLYQAHAGEGKAWPREEFITFARHVQGESEVDLVRLAPDLLAKASLDLDDFLQFMTSPATNILAPPEEQDLSWPLSSYFISSSHNTYLTGNQLYSSSSTEAYKNVLLRGCRCIEIDVWDGSEADESDEDSMSSSDDDDDPKVHEKRKAMVNRAKGVMPKSLVERLEKTSFGKRLENYVEWKKPESTASGTTASTPESAPLEETVTGSAPLKRAQTTRSSAAEPRVLHGHTLTKEVSFRSVCETIRDSAFVTSDLPLIVTLEVHCSPEQQEMMVTIMDEVWKDYLCPTPTSPPKHLPSPQSLLKKILVKVKYVPPDMEAVSNDSASASADSEDEKLPPAEKKAKKKKQKKPSKIIQALSRLGIYTRGVTFKSLTQPEATMPTHIFSLSEKGVMEVHEKMAKELFHHNRHYMMRAYPSGFRVRSSNLEPALFWRKGIQIVALNWQSCDEGMMENEGMFAGTGGYVLKPEGYRGIRAPLPDSPQPSEPSPAPQAVATKHYMLDLKIEVLAAQSLPLPEGHKDSSSFHPYVKVELHVEDSVEQQPPGKDNNGDGEHKRKTKSLKGRDPDYQGQVLSFDMIPGVVPELSFVRFTVRDDEWVQDCLAAWACVRLDRLREGYRFVHLREMKGLQSDGLLLVKVTKKLT